MGNLNWVVLFKGVATISCTGASGVRGAADLESAGEMVFSVIFLFVAQHSGQAAVLARRGLQALAAAVVLCASS